MGVTVRQKATLFIIFLFAIVTAAHAGQYEVTWVYDGDAIKAQGPEGEIRVRLMGIDAPETSKKKGQASQPYALAAKKHLMDLIYGKTVEIKGYGLDQYDRLLGVVYLDGKNINLEMVRAGLAEVYRGKMRKDFDVVPYTQAEQVARISQQGIWSVGNIHISPRAWRKGKQGR